MTLRRARMAAGLTSKEAALRLHVTPQTISRMEHGHTRNVSAVMVARMAAVYGLPVAEVLRLVVPEAMAVTA